MIDKNKEKIVKFFREILEVYDFQIRIDINKDLENIFRLIDIQKGNLGGIEQEEFFTLSDIIERLEVYHQDYVYTPLENKQTNNEKLVKDDWDLVAKRYLESDTVAKVLSEIHTQEYVDLTSKTRKFEILDIIKILDEDEKFYKSVCEKYVGTMSKEMLLEVDNKILHIYIEDEYIDLKEERKINSTNYEQYLDGNFEVEEYYFYQDLYNSIIKDEVAYDLNDLALFDDKGNWDFYITFEELKRMGYGFMVKDNYPLIEKYIIENETDFYDYFSLDELKEFEETLHLYYETDDIETNNWGELYSKSNKYFNHNIISLSEGMISYEDFISDYKIESQTYYEKLQKETNENSIESEMNFDY